MTIDADKLQELEELRARVQILETELRHVSDHWPPVGFYTEYYATTGFILGKFGALTSLLVNIVGALIFGKNPLELIRVYLTFPLGEKALQLTTAGKDVYAIGDSVILAVGCCLYLITGMVIGRPDPFLKR